MERKVWFTAEYVSAQWWVLRVLRMIFRNGVLCCLISHWIVPCYFCSSRGDLRRAIIASDLSWPSMELAQRRSTEGGYMKTSNLDYICHISWDLNICVPSLFELLHIASPDFLWVHLFFDCNQCYTSVSRHFRIWWYFVYCAHIWFSYVCAPHLCLCWDIICFFLYPDWLCLEYSSPWASSYSLG